MIEFEDVAAARDRIAPLVRRTPILPASAAKRPLGENLDVTLKLELLQATGSFKARGASNKLLSLDPAELANGIVTASGGNHGLATARAGYLAGVRTDIFLPGNATPEKIAKIKAWEANVHIVGDGWDAANEAAQAHLARAGGTYFHPFADPFVAAGQGTLGIEIVEQMGAVDVVLVAMGGGGLLAGVSTALRHLSPGTRIIGVEAAGSIGIDAVTTRVATMSCRKTDDRVFDLIQRRVEEIVLVEDDEMLAASKWLWFEFGLAADLSGAAAVAALQQGRIALGGGERICAIVCGTGSDAIRAE
jgi:threonine dehydratase